VDGRDEPGHDEKNHIGNTGCIFSQAFTTIYGAPPLQISQRII
jgi:hypothetical protein